VFHTPQAQEDRVTVIPDMSALGDVLTKPAQYRNFGFFGVFDGHNGCVGPRA
jgi:serine/threonine protein phosphatase PrpC